MKHQNPIRLSIQYEYGMDQERIFLPYIYYNHAYGKKYLISNTLTSSQRTELYLFSSILNNTKKTKSCPVVLATCVPLHFLAF